jgi:diguanylate cyclase (GGDEF)-like protein/PAS domain S-box-containing protein
LTNNDTAEPPRHPEFEGKKFVNQFRLLLLLAWALPPAIGMSFLVFIEIFSAGQMLRVLFSLPIVVYLAASLMLTDWYFGRYALPIFSYMSTRAPALAGAAEQRIRRFPLVFWAVFVIYVLLAPPLVIASAQLHGGYIAEPTDWFRIHLVALVVMIIVGLPVFFRFLDMFGRALSNARIATPHVTIRTKIFLIGALTPLMVDTMLVQYFWTRTGFFTSETFAVWLLLEVLAIAGTLMFMRSFGQALRPLAAIVAGRQLTEAETESLRPMSTDDLGVITGRYRMLADELRLHHRVLETSNRLLHNVSAARNNDCFAAVGDTCAGAIGDDKCYVFLRAETEDELRCVAHSGAEYNPDGHFRLPLSSPTLIAKSFQLRKTLLYVANENSDDARALLPDITAMAALLTPLIAENQTLGVLMTVNTAKQRQYSEQDVLLIEGVAREAALVIKTRVLLLQRLHTEERFKQLNELSQVTLESIGEGVITTDTFGSVIYMNQVAERLSGWSTNDARGRSLREVLRLRDEHTHEESAPEHYERLTRSSHSQYGLLANRDGNRENYVEISSTPLKNAKRQVIGAVLVLRDVSEIRRLVHKMSYQTSHDALTGLINRREFETVLDTALAAVHETGKAYVVCYLDLDQFKVVNDTCGHAAGDELMKQLSVKLAAALGEHDILARLGGDEFGVLLSDCTQDRGVEVAAHLLEVVKAMRFNWDDKVFTLAASIGVVPLAHQFARITDALRAADSACYVAKELGRNRVHIFHENDFAVARHHGQMQWMQRIQRALDENQFRLYLQPIVEVGNGDLARHGEVLVRMVDAGGEVITPGSFLPSAERYHLMPSIDRWVVRSFLNWARAQDAHTLNAPYFINLSGQSLSDGQFLDYVTGELKNSGVAPQLVGFEITETAAIQNVSRATHFISSLKSLGCRFALDDFGSGVSSFTYLKNLPVDYLKIDGSFVWDMANDRINTAMVESINQIGHLMGIKTIAECVENDHTLAALRKLGVDYVQGYHLGMPRPLH